MSPGAAVTSAVLAGLAFGALTSIVNVFSSGYGPHALVPGEGVAWLKFLSRFLDALWAWALLPFTVGWLVRRPATASLAGVGAIVAAVVGYYASDAALGMTALETGLVVLWALTGIVGAPVMVLLGRLARGRGPVGLVAALTAPGLMVAVALVDRAAPGDALDTAADRTVLTLAAVLTCGFVLRFARARVPGRGASS